MPPSVASTPAARADDLALIREACAEAAALALAMQGEDVASWSKGDGSPVSKADIAADRMLRERLTTARPDYGWLSEETADDLSRLDCRRTFVVDPIDGTRGYLAGGTNWCVCVAVVEAGRPILAAIDAPARSERYWAVAGGGAFRNGERLRIVPRADLGGARLAGTRRAVERLGDLGADIAGYIPSLALRLSLRRWRRARRLDRAWRRQGLGPGGGRADRRRGLAAPSPTRTGPASPTTGRTCATHPSSPVGSRRTAWT